MILKAPLSETTVRSLKLGEEVVVSGTVLTARDEAHMRALEHAKLGQELPFDPTDGIIFHCGPIVERKENGWKMIAAGPTTSARMNAMEPEFIRRFKPRAIIGKGGMSQATSEAMREVGCVYLAFTGGAAVVGAKGIKAVRGVHWLDLGMPEAVWELELEDFGPLIVAMDCHGRSTYADVAKDVAIRTKALNEKL